MARVSLEEKLRTVQRERLALEEDIQKVRLTAFFWGGQKLHTIMRHVCVWYVSHSQYGCMCECVRVRAHVLVKR